MTNIETTLNDVFRLTPLGDVRSAIGTTFFGINHRQTPMPVPINSDGYGLVLFTRPQMNLTDGNMRTERKFIPLLTKEDTSIQRIIRCYLDPRLNFDPSNKIDCPYVDHKLAFMPLLTNNILSMSGWPDPVIETFNSKPGVYKEVYGFTDSIVENYGTFDLSSTFRNMQSDPITAMIWHWMLYMANVWKGNMVPYPDYLVKNAVDYQTGIYRLVLDRSKRFVQKIAQTRAQPVSSNLGTAFNYDSEKPLNESAERIEVQWRCYGATYEDPIIVSQFNRVVGIFNPAMRVYPNETLPRAANGGGGTVMPVPMESLQYFNCRGYPFINPDTRELLWYVDISDFNALMESYKRTVTALKSTVDQDFRFSTINRKATQ